MHEYENKLLAFLKDNGASSIEEMEAKLGIGNDAILWAIENLSKQGAIAVKRDAESGVWLTDEGKEDLEEFPEERLVKKLERSGNKWSVSEINDSIGLSWCKKNRWINIEGNMAVLTGEGLAVAKGSRQYAARMLLGRLNRAKAGEVTQIVSQNKDLVGTLSKRGLIGFRERSVVKSVSITKTGSDMLSSSPHDSGIGALTKEIIKSGEWKNKQFKRYDVNAPFEEVLPGRTHLLREFINFVRMVWLEMGFVEVSGPIIDSAFWNFDALFSPQDHPTREMQDTFFLSNPKQLTIDDLGVLERVRRMHTNAWKEEWSKELAQSAVLRTHTTSVSAHYMNKLAGAVNANYPLRFFSIGPVFRNENLDYKHLAEMRMCDGIIIGDDLTLSNLVYTLKSFYSRIGLDVKFRPSYFPFTEPSLEVFYYDKEHGDSIELAGSGMIRKEITKAMGINKKVLAWGLGLDRLLLSSKVCGLDSITVLYKNNVGWLRSRPNIKV